MAACGRTRICGPVEERAPCRRGEGDMKTHEARQLVLATARVLFCNGQSTNQVVVGAERMGHALGLQVEIRPRWGELYLDVTTNGERSVSSVAAVPAGIDMNRVVSATRVIDGVVAGSMTPAAAQRAIAEISTSASSPTWLFALAVGVAAVSLSAIYGVQHLLSVVLIFFAAVAGAILRRWLGRRSPNLLIQPFSAALLAGLVGAFAAKLVPDSALRLVAICPCMAMVPGPHILNGAFDLIHGRMHLGASRLLFAGMIVLSIAAGLLIGLTIPGVSLPVEATGFAVPLWQDVLAAGAAAACFSIFYSTPSRFLLFPVLVGMIAHALRTASIIDLGFDISTGAIVGCIFVGLAMTPLARWQRLPFSALAFASVVSMMPGIFFFRVASGLVQIAHLGGAKAAHLVPETIGDAMTAFMIVMAMTVGLIVPKTMIDHFFPLRDAQVRP